jgi:LPS O-antigen subunit length determinant protein (WzzB/FepE family)
MNYKNKYIIITLVLILILGLAYRYFSPGSKTENKAIEPSAMTEEQKFDILSAISSGTPANTISKAEKEKILSQAAKNNKAITTLSREEILQFLNKTN